MSRRAEQPRPEEMEEEPDEQRIVHRPDGYYCVSEATGSEWGPFASAEEALTRGVADADDELEPGETLEEAEAELGIANWSDPDTNELAEATTVRIEDH